MIKSRNIELDKALVNNRTNFLAPSVNPKTATVVTKTADYTVLSTDFGKIFNNTGDTGSQTLTLPDAAAVAGKSLKIACTAAQDIVLDPGTGKIWLNGSGVADKTLTIAGVIGNFCEIYSDGTDYIVTNYSGVVTKEA
jgi:hypothetical protein